MKSLFSRFSKPAAPGPGTGPPPPGKSRLRPSLDEKKPVQEDDDSTVRVKRKPSLRPRAGLASVTNRASLRRSPTPSSTASGASNGKPAASGAGGSNSAARAATRHARSASVASRASSHAHSHTDKAPPAAAAPPKGEPLDPSPLPPIPDIPLSTDSLGEWGAAVRAPRHRVSFDNVKKVAFQSPSRGTGTPPPTASETDLRRATLPARGPSRRQSAGSPTRQLIRSASTNSRPSSPSRGNVAQTQQPPQLSRSSSTTSHQFRKSSLADVHESPTKSTKSSLTLDPSDNDAMSEKSYLPQPESWSAIMDEELIANLGPRERARQEVLWEIINSEERYVRDLLLLNDTFCKTLLPPRDDPSLALPDPLALTRTLSPSTSSGSHEHHQPSSSPLQHSPSSGSTPYLPIAAQFSSNARFSTESFREHILGQQQQGGSPQQNDASSPEGRADAYAALTRSGPEQQQQQQPPQQPQHSHPQQQQPPPPAPPAPRPSLPPMSRQATQTSIATNKHRNSFHSRTNDGGHSRITSRSSMSSVINGPVTLPDDLEQVLTVISTGILDGHIKQIEALRERYNEQFPLVRSLANVFTSHSDILREYATYILHLERALAQIDEALLMAETIAQGGRRSSRRLEETQLGRLGKLLQSLEELAAERGEPGLSIALSKPFQRLLKYPLLFQNLLYNTSPSTKEYEATLAMVDEVQTIVRSIEDEKATNEERERTRDAWARIDGFEKNKALMAPKPTRLLVSEASAKAAAAPERAPRALKERKSHHRLSDMLKGRSAELWVVRFTDVSLLCELVGSTTLPISTVSGNGAPRGDRAEKAARRMSSMSALGRRHASLKARNLYKFVKVHEWHEARPAPTPAAPRAGLGFPRRGMLGGVAENATPTRLPPPASPAPTPTPTPTRVPLKDADGSPTRLVRSRHPLSEAGDDASESMSVMSFAFRGDARPAVRRIRPAGAAGAGVKPTVRRSLGAAPAATGAPLSMAGGNANVNAKFANRLREDVTVRPASRVRRSLPPAMALDAAARPGSVPAGVGRRPPWNSSTRPEAASTRDLPATAKKIVRPRTSAGERERESSVTAPTAASVARRRNLGGHI